MSNVEVTVNGKKSELLTKMMNGGAMTDLEKNEAVTRKLEKLKDKLVDGGEVDYVKEIDKMSNDELKKKLLGFIQEMERIDDEKANCQELVSAQAKARTLSKGFSDAKKPVRTKLQFVFTTLQSRGVKLVSEEPAKS